MKLNNHVQQPEGHFDNCSTESCKILVDVTCQIEEADCEDRTMVSRALANDEECIEKDAEIEAYKQLIIEFILGNLAEEHADIVTAYIALVEERHEDTKAIADMMVYDARSMNETR
ncbi:MAG: hypothetical protein K2J60_08585 [Acetatifactor sp.]|nr:hypothetical protein [Acetatifactor sp.]